MKMARLSTSARGTRLKQHSQEANVTNDWQEIWSEQELMQAFDLSKSDLESLRAKGMPYIRVSVRKRLYDRDEVLPWLRAQGASRPSVKRPEDKRRKGDD
jgi:hypothetical protein